MDSTAPLHSALHDFALTTKRYVDKSAQLISFINYLTNEPRLLAPNIFMVVRPRGFGLSLAADTIETVLSVQEEFSGDHKAEELHQQLRPLPVVRLSMRKLHLNSAAAFRDHLADLMQSQLWEHHINKNPASYQNPKSCLAELIKAVSTVHQSPVAVIIDNYDAPFLCAYMLPPAERDAVITLYLDTLNAIKQAGRAVAFALLTGHVKFDLSSLNSEGLPAIKDISSYPCCDTLFGFTPAEVQKYLAADLKLMAPRRGMTAAELLQALEVCYGGFVFSDRQIKLLCPYSVNAALNNEGQLLTYQAQEDYEFLQRLLEKYEPALDWLFDKDGQDALFADSVSLEPTRLDFGTALVQLGFATITKVTRSEGEDYINWRYRYGCPNEEMRRLLLMLRRQADPLLAALPINPRALTAGCEDYML